MDQRISTNARSPRLLDEVRDAMRRKHYSLRTEKTYIHWIRRLIYFHDKRHPRELGEGDINAVLNHLARDRKVASSTRNQALSAILFLYKEVLGHQLAWLDALERPKRPVRLPVVLTEMETKAFLARLKGTKWLTAGLLYGTGLRLMECLRLRVNDIDFEYRQIVVRDGKGQKDRVTMRPEALIEPQQNHLARVKSLHLRALAGGYGEVHLPFALARKYPNAGRE